MSLQKFSPASLLCSLLLCLGIGLQAQITADFTYTASCAGEPTQFVDASYGGTAVYWYWNFGDGGWSNDQNPVHTYAAPGTYSVYLVVESAGPGWDSSGVVKSVDIAADCDTFNRIEGKIYFDENDDGVFGGADLPYGGRLVKATPGPYYGMSDAAGDYHIYVPTGSYTVEITPPDLMHVSEPTAGTYSVSFPSTGDLDSGNDFGLGADVVADDISVFLSSGIPPRPGLDYDTYITYTNSGTTVLGGSLSLTPDALGTFSYASVTPASVGSTIDWNYSGLLPGQSETIEVVFDISTSATIGDAVTLSADAPLAFDSNPGDNTASMTDSVVNSWDPNDIAVDPAGLAPDGAIPMETEWLTYTIRFQNTGTAPAIDVVIEDQLDPMLLDLSTFQMLSASHSYDFSIADGDVLTWSFEGINLPDSGSNMLGSNGMIVYRIKLNPGMAEGTAISNRASIFFDFNPPVITNTVTVTLREMSTGIPTPQEFESLTLFPNPANSVLNLEFVSESAGEVSLAVLDLQGRVIRALAPQTFQTGAARQSLSVEDLIPGLYLLRVRTGSGEHTIPWIKSSN